MKYSLTKQTLRPQLNEIVCWNVLDWVKILKNKHPNLVLLAWNHVAIFDDGIGWPELWHLFVCYKEHNSDYPQVVVVHCTVNFFF